jgi:hypothetical protein
MMNINKPMKLVRENFKLSVIKAFTDHKNEYGLDKDKIEENSYLKKTCKINCLLDSWLLVF